MSTSEPAGIRRLGRQTVVYGLSGAAPQIVGLVTLPIVARVLTTADYGVLEIALAATSLLVIFADLGLGTATQRSYFDYADADEPQRRSVVATALVTTVGATALIAGLAVALRGEIAAAIFGSRERDDIVVWMALSLAVTQVAVFTRDVLRLRFLSTAYLASSFATAVIGGAASVIGVTVLDGGPGAMLAGGAIGAAVAAAYGLLRTRDCTVGTLSGHELRRMLSFGLPLVPTALFVWALTLVDRLLLEHFGSLREVGEYGMANRLASGTLLVVTAFGIAFVPYALDLRTRDEAQERSVRVTALALLVAGASFIGAMTSLFAREALEVLAPDFDGAADAVGVLCLGAVLYGISSVVMIEISVARRSHVFALTTGLAAALNIALNIALIGPLGVVGSGLATAATYLVLAAAYWWHAQRLAATPYRTSWIVTVVAAATAVGALGLLPLGWAWLPVKILGGAALVAFLLRAAPDGERTIGSLLARRGRTENAAT